MVHAGFPYEQYIEEFKNQMLMRTCPVHGEGTMYKEQMAMMHAQAHAYAYHMFLYFEHMSKSSEAPEQKAYYK